MRAKCVAIAAVAMMMTLPGFSQARVKPIVLNAGTSDARAAPTANNFVGVWHGEYRGLPWVTVTLTQHGGALSGAILFYLHRKAPGTAETATAGTPEPLLDPQFNGKTLTFRVNARHADPPKILNDPPIVMSMESIDQDHVRLVNKEDPHLTGPLTLMWR
ncbi:MAG TPA: hypothetical protein VF018_02110 [Acidobacteriaceae bacterium]